MQTTFTLAQLADPQVSESEKILRACVHCGFCLATCPTYVLLGDENDSPRGRIYLMKEMLEQNAAPTRHVVKHIDRCLSCLACMTTCPSGVHYMHLVDHAREYIEENYRRPLTDRFYRAMLAAIMPHPRRFRRALFFGRFVKPFAPLFAAIGLKPVAAMLALAPWKVKSTSVETGRVFAAEGQKRGRVALMSGCVDPVVKPEVRDSAIRLLTRHGIEVVLAWGEGCCGSLVHHMGREEKALAQARNNIDAWTLELEGQGLDAILITASGCGTTVKDYGFMLRTDPKYAEKAARVSTLAKDITEFLATLGLRAPARKMSVAYHSACSMQHGQQVTREPKALLAAVGFDVRDVAEGHLCCGSAGTYNMLQPEIAKRLRDRKVENIERTKPDVIAAGNVGCLWQIGSGTAIPTAHTVELLDWATGGPKPAALA
ncbi:MAG TPA: glycolate oxidase subunit GlcF [Xanthobacteraceae bacterium]|nr:glycolate oxidase subunit GlcF [Xanthobacteraceae bacterium]